MSPKEAKLEALALAIMYSPLHDERLAWQTIPFEITDRLQQQGMIDEPRTSRKSLYLTDEGLARAKVAFDALCSAQDERQAPSR